MLILLLPSITVQNLSRTCCASSEDALVNFLSKTLASEIYTENKQIKKALNIKNALRSIEVLLHFFPRASPEISPVALKNLTPNTQAKIVEQDELTLRRDTISSAVTKREL